jgi:hypothetical protein
MATAGVEEHFPLKKRLRLWTPVNDTEQTPVNGTEWTPMNSVWSISSGLLALANSWSTPTQEAEPVGPHHEVVKEYVSPTPAERKAPHAPREPSGLRGSVTVRR